MKHKTWSSNHPIQHPHPHAPNYHRLFFISPLPPLSFLSSSPPFPIPITSFPTFLAFLPHFLYSLSILPLQNHHPLVLAIHSLFTPSTPFTSPLPPPPLTSCSRLTASCSSNLSQLFSMVPPAPQNPRGYEKAVSHLFEGIVSMLSCKKVKKLRLKEVCNKQRDEEKRKIFRILYIREGLKERE